MNGALFQSLFESAPTCLLALRADADFTIVAVTDAYLAATLTERDLILGRGLFKVFPDDARDASADGVSNLRASLLRVLANKAPDSMAVQKYSIERPAEAGGGFEERHWSPRNHPVFDTEGRLCFILHRVEDVTGMVQASDHGAAMEREVLARSRELAEALAELREAHARQGELDRAKTEFFDNVSHEFRTPLSLLLGHAEDLLAERATPLAPGHLEQVRAVHRNSLRMLKLVNALLDFSRFDSRLTQSRFSATDLAGVTREIAHAFDSHFARAGIAYRVECPPLSEHVYVNLEQWEKIVLNLISNALKYTTHGGVTVSLGELPTSAVLQVEDSGAGIPAEHQDKVFQRFHRVPGIESRSHEGAGIGLALVAELVRAHGGQLGLRSEPGVGSAFTVSIPKGHAHLDPASVIERAVAPERHSTGLYLADSESWLANVVDSRNEPDIPSVGAPRPHVLVVDDNPDLRRLMSRWLGAQFEVELATDGEEGLARIRARRPDVVVSDAMMPRMDGFQLLRALRDDPTLSGLQVIMLSGRADAESQASEEHVEADDYLIKPFTRPELMSRVRKLIALAQARSAIECELERARQERAALRKAEGEERETLL